MKSYTLQIGQGSGDEMKTVAFSEEIFADSLLEAIDKAKALTLTRPVHAKEDTALILDEANPEGPVIWARSINDIRHG